MTKVCQYNTTIEVNDVSVPIIVVYYAHKFRAGKTDGRHGPKLEPDEPAEIEIEYIIQYGRQVELTEGQKSQLREEIADYLCDDPHVNYPY